MPYINPTVSLTWGNVANRQVIPTNPCIRGIVIRTFRTQAHTQDTRRVRGQGTYPWVA